MRKTQSRNSRKRSRSVVMPPTLRYRSNSNSKNTAKTRPPSRMLMRPWLEDLLDRNCCRGLQWSNKKEKKFTIVWRHASSHGFDQSEHGDVFCQWAWHTGKLRKNSKGDHSSNKSNFRCALHSLKDCIELTSPGEKKGEHAKRTFQFIEPGHPKFGGNRKGKNKQKRSKQETDLAEVAAAASFISQGTPEMDLLLENSQLKDQQEEESTELDMKGVFSGDTISLAFVGFGSTSYCNRNPSLSSSPSTTSAAASPLTSSPSCSNTEVISHSSNAFHQSSSSMSDSSVQSSKLPNFEKFWDHPKKIEIDTPTTLVKKRIKLISGPQGRPGIELVPVVLDHPSNSTFDHGVSEADIGSNLPNFNALEDPSYNYANKNLNSGGVVKVKKPKPETLSFGEITIPFLPQSKNLDQHHEQPELFSLQQAVLGERLKQHQMQQQERENQQFQSVQGQQQLQNFQNQQETTLPELDIGRNETVADSVSQEVDGSQYRQFTPMDEEADSQSLSFGYSFQEGENDSCVPSFGDPEESSSVFMDAQTTLMSTADNMLSTVVEPSRQEETDFPTSLFDEDDIFSLESC